MNDLRLLLQIDKSRRIVSLEFKQIVNLEPMVPLLQKFEHIQSLSLHGNRMKHLPPNLSCFQHLIQLDLSNNLFQSVEDILPSLKTIPNLNHLIYSFRSRQQEDYLKSQLPKLQRVNKKPLNNKVINSTHTKTRRQLMRLNEQDLQEIGQIYDEIRGIYRKSKYLMDKQLAQDFDKNVESIMSDLSSKISKIQNQGTVNNSIITCKYALLDICFVKLITYFYQFDKGIAVTLQKIHDYQAELFKSLSEVIIIEVQRSNNQINTITLKKQQIYHKEIKRLKSYQLYLNKQIQQLETTNNQIISKLIKLGKQDTLELTINHTYNKNRQLNRNNKSTSQAQRTKSPGKRSFKMNQRMDQMVVYPNTSKALTLFQLKDAINQIILSKQKNNQACYQTGRPMETMQNFMYTFLNQKYGLKGITVEWAMNIVNGIKKYGSQDVQIATFGKILRNQIDQQFYFQLRKSKLQLYAQIKKFKSDTDQKLVTINQSEQILLNMQIKRQYITIILSKVRQSQMVKNCLPYQTLQKITLDYLLKKHAQNLSKIISVFKSADQNEDGIINHDELKLICQNAKQSIDIDQLIIILDPHKTNVITFSHFIECYLKNSELKQVFGKQS